MASTTVTPQNQKILDKYFANIKDLRAGDPDSVDRLVAMWDDDGIFEFAGAPPVTGTFQGKAAIHVLYKNRVGTGGMPLHLEGAPAAAPAGAAPAAGATAGPVGSAPSPTNLGIVDTNVHHTRQLHNDRVVAGWTTVVGTGDGRGFEVSGSHTFTFRNGKIRTLKVVVSPRPDPAQAHHNLNLHALSVDDVGRLALAAWAVV
jgi:ketosteroid isomerase-like protein